MSQQTTRAAQHAQTTKHGPLVNRQLLLELVTPSIEKHGIGKFARWAGVDPSALGHCLNGTNGRDRTRLDFADKLLTCGMGRPDLVELVCPLGGVESGVGEASSRRGRTPREVA